MTAFRTIRTLALSTALFSVGCGLEQAPLDEVKADTRAIVYGTDDRQDVYAHPDATLKLRAQQSTVALMSKSDLNTANRQVTFYSETLGSAVNLCVSERFRVDPTAAFCSGTLIDDDLVLTAGHCITNAADCADARFVFNYYRVAEGTLQTVTNSDVFSCASIVVRALSSSGGQELDYGIIRLDRAAAPRFTPAPVRAEESAMSVGQNVAVIGSGSGIPFKIDSGGKVRDARSGILDYFVATTDTFGGNSGSGVYETAGYTVAGILVRGGTDYESNGVCTVVNVCSENGCDGEGITYVQRAIRAYCAANTSARLCPANPTENDPPAATAQSVSTAEETALAITLAATDADGDPLTYSVVAGPAKGTASGTAPNLTYTPAANFNGTDSIAFKVNDGALDSAVATVRITVTPVNDAPVATAQAVKTAEETALSITLAASDVDGDSLVYSVVVGPANGTLSGTAPKLTYTPAADANGTDSFTFKVNDGTTDSAVAAVSLTVTGVNDAPVAGEQTVTTSEETAVAMELGAVDVDGDALTWTIVTQPAHGALSGDAPKLTYTPATDFAGEDGFSFKVNDGVADSAEATATITVTPVEEPAIADSGCSCTTGGDPSPLLAAAFLLLAIGRRQAPALRDAARRGRNRHPVRNEHE